jgi:antitoxin component YwqK of YwqJK toxin-antitoxin module
MKKIIVYFFITSLSLLDVESIEVSIKTLQKRGEVDNQLYYLPNQDIPFTGKAVAYYRNGRKMTEISYKDGKQDGLKSHWYESGQKWVERNYKDGKMHGLYTMWYENGQWRRTGNHMDGKMDGIWTHWYENGQQRDELFYIDGFKESAIVWKPNGEKCSMTDVKAGNGIMVKYMDDGTDWLRISYKYGEKHGYRLTYKDSERVMRLTP